MEQRDTPDIVDQYEQLGIQAIHDQLEFDLLGMPLLTELLEPDLH